MKRSILRPALVLGLITAIGPFAIDMYLPAIPAIGRDLGTDSTGMQATLTLYFVVFGLGQLFYGPWADQVGRKKPLYLGMALFGLGTAMCILAPTAHWLVAGRMVQGAGGAALGVIPRAIVRDMMTGAEATRMMATIMLVFSISPMLAPLTGSALLTITGWRGIFGALLVALAMGLALLTFLQPETLPAEKRRPLKLRLLIRGLGELFRDRTFLLLSFIAGFGFSSFMIFLSAASYVYTESFGLKPAEFSLAFAANAIFFFASSQAASWAQLKYGVRKVLTYAAAWFCAVDVVLFLLALSGHATLYPTVALLGLGNAGLGLIIPTTMVLAMDTQGEKAGLASSLGGTVQMMTGALVAMAIGPWLDGTPLPMLAGIALASSTAFILVLLAMRSYAATEGSPA